MKTSAHTARISIDCNLPHRQLTELLAPRVIGQQVGDSMTVRDFELKGDDTWLYTDIRVTGVVSGRVTIRYKLDYDKEQRQFTLAESQVDFVGKKGLLARGAKWLMKNILKQSIETTVQKMLNEHVTSMVQEVASRARSIDIGKGFRVICDLGDFIFEDLRWDESGLRCRAITDAGFGLMLNDEEGQP